MRKNVLIISVCRDKLHELEFVKPIEDILDRNNIGNFVRGYRDISDADFNITSHIIICGTSLMDNNFMKDIEMFGWLRDCKKPVLGICAGMHIVGAVFGGKFLCGKEIGYYHERFEKEFLGLLGEREVWHLHNNYISGWDDFNILCKSGKIVQAVKCKKMEIYCVLFHPEVRNKEIILEFVGK